MAAKANIRRAGLRHTGRAGVSQWTDSTVGSVARGGTVVPEGGLTIKPDEGSPSLHEAEGGSGGKWRHEWPFAATISIHSWYKLGTPSTLACR